MPSGNTLTQESYDHFKAHGCVPCCHVCDEFIPVGSLFGFNSVDLGQDGGFSQSVEVMVCGGCIGKPLPQEQQDYALSLIGSGYQRKKRRLLEERLRKLWRQWRTSSPSKSRTIMKRIRETEDRMKYGPGCFLVDGEIRR